MRFNDTQKITIMESKIIEDLREKEMKAESVSHLVGQMEATLEILEFRIQQIDMKDYQMELLMDQISKANAVNDEIFELHKKNELDRIKKIYNNLSDENK